MAKKGKAGRKARGMSEPLPKKLQEMVDIAVTNQDRPLNFTEMTGTSVFCDCCGRDYTNSNANGGGLEGSWAVCPECYENAKADFARDGTIQLCPEGMSFADWVRSRR